MKVKKEVLLKFLKLVAIQGEVENKEALVTINKDMDVLCIAEGQHVALHGILKGDFEDLGTIGIDNVQELISFVNNFSNDEVTITKKENKLVVDSAKDKLKISCILKNPDYILNKITAEKFDTLLQKAEGNEFKLTKEILKKLISYCNSFKTKELTLSGKNTELSLSLNDDKENSLVGDFEISKLKSSFSIKVSKILIDILKTVDGEVELSIKEGTPIMIKTKTDDYSVIYMLAQLKK